jgi:hypothetical protein
MSRWGVKYLVTMTARVRAVCFVKVDAAHPAEAKERALDAALGGDWEVHEPPDVTEIVVNSVDVADV